jgi:hypothetical protein
MATRILKLAGAGVRMVIHGLPTNIGTGGNWEKVTGVCDMQQSILFSLYINLSSHRHQASRYRDEKGNSVNVGHVGHPILYQ